MKIKSLVFCLAGCLSLFLACGGNQAQVPTAQNDPASHDSTLRKLKDTIRITAVGDIMLGSAYPSKTGLPPDDARSSFAAADSFLTGDVVFGNLEGCLLDNGKSSKCKDPLSNSCFAFRMPERYAGIIQKAGFNVLSIANNHVGDFDTGGRKRTAAVLDSLQINYAGQLDKPYALFEKDSVRYAFCAFAPNENCVSINNLQQARALVSSLKARADIVIVSFHGGAEGAKFERVPKRNEIFYRENRGNVYAFAHAVIDAGADVVLGHGPHVTRAVELYKKRFIAYSLGNFCTYGMFSLKGPNGVAPLLQLALNSKGEFLSAKVISVKQDKVNRLQLDPAGTAFRKLSTLSKLDFPGNALNFSVAGNITAVQQPEGR
ncbi:capsule biosynthesis protein CapA [Pedobacter yulinensis]|uniref:Capsule biosynthesis protein CapA n=1 Tax=Pedobacter yulinensis TaxID=2126353 RepID=A0A2T3HR03_9SPHI|nr:CapA family protein [Pedobacter yulinensis]PST84859.1 capsule biosynthesis protein CapA [Pedobacter yulinensis]